MARVLPVIGANTMLLIVRAGGAAPRGYSTPTALSGAYAIERGRGL